MILNIGIHKSEQSLIEYMESYYEDGHGRLSGGRILWLSWPSGYDAWAKGSRKL